MALAEFKGRSEIPTVALPPSRGLASHALQLVLRIARVDQAVEENGLPGGARRIIGDIRAPFYETGPLDTEAVLREEPVLVIAAHHGFTGIPQPTAILAALPNREDISVAASANIVAASGPRIQPHLIPLSTDHTQSTQARGRLFQAIRPPSIPRGQAKLMNISGVTEAQQRVARGGLLLFFPDGPGDKEGRPWQRGIIELMRRLPPTTHVVFAAAREISPGRFIPGIGRLFPEPQVSFSQPSTSGHFLMSSDPLVSLRSAYDAFLAISPTKNSSMPKRL